MWSFYQFVRQSVADNKPWDRFARDILTASGSTLHNGAANYFVLHKDVTDLTEATVGHVPGHVDHLLLAATIIRWRNGRRINTGAWPTCSPASASRTATAPAR